MRDIIYELHILNILVNILILSILQIGEKNHPRGYIYANNIITNIAHRWLFVQLSKLLPKGTKIIEEYHHPLCYWEEFSQQMEFDIWVPDYNLALEYQGN